MAQDVGTQIGNTLGSILNPVLGGTTTTTVTEKPGSGSSTTTIVIIAVVVVIIGIVGFLVYKNKRG